jgi:hypothetical protein
LLLRKKLVDDLIKAIDHPKHNIGREIWRADTEIVCLPSLPCPFGDCAIHDRSAAYELPADFAAVAVA